MPELLVLGCSSRKFDFPDAAPALHRYNGPLYQDIRAHLRRRIWPDSLDIAVLSAEFGLIGALTEIHDYDRRMTPDRAKELEPVLRSQIAAWISQYDQINFCLGKDYLLALPTDKLNEWGRANIFEGPIGVKRKQLATYLRNLTSTDRSPFDYRPARHRLSYFLPDWDDLIDTEFDFKTDTFSAPKRERQEQHCSSMMRPYKIADGILVSLAQKRESKGPLRYVGGLQPKTLHPINLRAHYGLNKTQALFGDCGAFSYINDESPPITTEYAVSMYELYNFDYGASIDHIPALAINTPDGKRKLTAAERRKRVELTINNADAFIASAKRRKAGFLPVGAIQGLSSKDYARNACLYTDMGYERIALGGLVPLSSQLIYEIVRETMDELKAYRKSLPDVHLFGIFRPELQAAFKSMGVASFDSATYFRKAWLRSNQNYLAHNGEWYTAIRVPMTTDSRTRCQFLKSGKDLNHLAKLESVALNALHSYEDGKILWQEALNAVIEYDQHFERSSENKSIVATRYERTLRDKPWENCPCKICKSIGIDVLIFRGSNRNKRRGAHNTWQLYREMRKVKGSKCDPFNAY